MLKIYHLFKVILLHFCPLYQLIHPTVFFLLPLGSGSAVKSDICPKVRSVEGAGVLITTDLHLLRYYHPELNKRISALKKTEGKLCEIQCTSL